MRMIRTFTPNLHPAADARRRWTAELNLRRADRHVVAVPNCGQCHGSGYTGPTPGAKTISEIRLGIHAESIQLCRCESGRTMEALLRDD